MSEGVALRVEDESPTARVVRQAMSGDADAFDRLIGPRLDRQIRFAMSLLRDEQDARDVVQETCIRAWRDLPALRDPERFDSWLNQILINVARTHLKSRRRMHVRELPADEMTVEGQATGSRPPPDVSETDTIRRAFARLHPDKRLLLVLRHVEGLPVLDIARLLRIPEGTAKWRLHAARAELERALEIEER